MGAVGAVAPVAFFIRNVMGALRVHRQKNYKHV